MRFRLRKGEKAEDIESEPVEPEKPAECDKCRVILPAGALECPYCGEVQKLPALSGNGRDGPRSIKRTLLLLLRDVGVAVLIVLIILGAIFAYTRVWPPMVVIESNSMQHDDRVSYIGVIDTGDLVLVQTAPQRSDVITWVEGKATGYQTYSNYGDVIIFKKLNYDTPIIHRPIFWMDYNPATKKFNITSLEDPALRGLWGGTYNNGTTVVVPRDLDGTIWISGSGWKGDLTFTFRIFNSFIRDLSSPRYNYSGYVTLGDNNAYKGGGYDDYLVRQEDVYGKARGELPWFGLIKLTLAPSPGVCCPRGWGDPYAPKNSWDSLVISLVLIIVAPIVIDITFALWHRWRLKRAESEKGAPEANPSAEETHKIPQASRGPSIDGPPDVQSDPTAEGPPQEPSV